jgi:hypothetical protein
MTMPRKKSLETKGSGVADPARAAARERLLDLIARLLARRWLRVRGEEAEGKSSGEARRGKAE